MSAGQFCLAIVCGAASCLADAESDRKGGVQVSIPDFTRGAWRTAKPVPIGDIDLERMGFDFKLADKVDKQLVV